MDAKESTDTRNVEVEDRATEIHVGVIKHRKPSGDARRRSGSQIVKVSKNISIDKPYLVVVEYFL